MRRTLGSILSQGKDTLDKEVAQQRGRILELEKANAELSSQLAKQNVQLSMQFARENAEMASVFTKRFEQMEGLIEQLQQQMNTQQALQLRSSS